MTRKFNQGKQSELLFNQEQYSLYQLLKHLNENPYAETDEQGNQLSEPRADIDGALWLDRFDGGDLKFYANGRWNLAFNDKFSMIKDILIPERPETGVLGQLWIDNKSGQMFYWDGTGMWKEIVATTAPTDSALASFSDFMMISPLQMQGSVVIDAPVWTAGQEPHAGYNTDDTSLTAENRRESYWVGDIVLYQGQYFECIVEHIPTTEITPFDTAYWKPMTNPVMMSQFLLPSVDMDKFFVNGRYTDDYITKTNVCIQYPTEDLQGAVAAGVHVNPSRLINIKKKLFAIDPINPVIECNEINTEFYAFKNGIGSLLFKTGDNNTDYMSSAVGIRLMPKIVSAYDFVLAVTYQFANSRHLGKLYRGHIELDGTGNHGIYIGNIADPITVFIQGLYLDENYAAYVPWVANKAYVVGDKVSYDNQYYMCNTDHTSNATFDTAEMAYWDYESAQVTYEYNPNTGYLTMPLEKELDVAIISFPRVERGTIKIDADTNKGFIQLDTTRTGFTEFKQPLVFVCGQSLSTPVALADYTYDSTLKRFWIDNAQSGMAYAVAEADNSSESNPNYNMFVASDIVPEPTSGNQTAIPCDFTQIPEDIDPIIFVDGIIVSGKDITRNQDGSFSIYGLMPGQDYTLLKDIEGRVLFDDIASFITIPVKDASGQNVTIDDATIYIEDSIICDAKAVYTSVEPKNLPPGGNGEIKLYMGNGVEQWCKYDAIKREWTSITDTNMINLFDSTAADTGYTVSKKAISILNDFCQGAPKNCTYFGYAYANTIEEPMHIGDMHISQDQTVCKVGFKDLYPKDVNALSVWIDGLRQYYITESSDSRTFTLPEEIGSPTGSNLFYVVEKPEGQEIKSCEREIVNQRDSVTGKISGKIDGILNTFQTTIPLFPGNLRVYIGGIRQPSSAYKVIDAYTIMFKDPVRGGMSEDELAPFEIEKNGVLTTCYPIEDEILIEVRQDYSLRECTIAAKPGQRVFTVQSDGIPETLLDSRDFIMIYVNGQAYGKGYVIDKNNGSIELTNRDVTDYLSTDNMAAYFNSNPDAYTRWKLKTGNSYYEPKVIKDYITFEWR